MGNPHCVIITDDDPMELAVKYGPVIEKHEFFPKKQIPNLLKLSRVWKLICVFLNADAVLR